MCLSAEKVVRVRACVNVNLTLPVLGEMCLSTEKVVDAALFDARQVIGRGNAC